MAISVLPPPVFGKPCKTDLSGLTVLADFSALCWDFDLEENSLLGELSLDIPGDDMIAFILLLVGFKHDVSAVLILGKQLDFQEPLPNGRGDSPA